ncbi:hypothetical protein H2248_007118 [Termitomyces sp. 'cryptogamus']|nr:hypothetical protein H2248_007118 [Termitomyces sp. 'cryptogamus']
MGSSCGVGSGISSVLFVGGIALILSFEPTKRALIPFEESRDSATLAFYMFCHTGCVKIGASKFQNFQASGPKIKTWFAVCSRSCPQRNLHASYPKQYSTPSWEERIIAEVLKEHICTERTSSLL